MYVCLYLCMYVYARTHTYAWVVHIYARVLHIHTYIRTTQVCVRVRVRAGVACLLVVCCCCCWCWCWDRNLGSWREQSSSPGSELTHLRLRAHSQTTTHPSAHCITHYSVILTVLRISLIWLQPFYNNNTHHRKNKTKNILLRHI